MSDLKELEDKLKIKFNNQLLLEQAFVHRSYLNENEFPLGHNEKLEFLGDAVLELITTDYLYAQFPDKTEGELTALRAALVKRETLTNVATELEFYKYLKLSKGEAKTVNNQAAILANTVEALIGAIYLDTGLEIAKQFITAYLFPKLDHIIKSSAYIDAKSQLQEIIQEKSGITPHYAVIKESGPDHNKEFIVAVYAKTKKLAEGIGNSKQIAQTDAATKAIETLE